MTAALAHMGPVGWICVVVGSWTVLACVVALPIGKAMSRADRKQYPPEVPERVNWLPVLPAVPPTRSELAYLRDQPAEILTGDDLRLRFEDVINSARRAEQDAQ
jgi:hypothetical protein